MSYIEEQTLFLRSSDVISIGLQFLLIGEAEDAIRNDDLTDDSQDQTRAEDDRQVNRERGHTAS